MVVLRRALQYTTNQSALGAGLLPGLRPKGPVYQTVDVFSMKLVNEYSYQPLPFIKFVNIAVADLDAQSDSRVAVSWRQFKVRLHATGGTPPLPRQRGASKRAEARWVRSRFAGGSVQAGAAAVYALSCGAGVGDVGDRGRRQWRVAGHNLPGLRPAHCARPSRRPLHPHTRRLSVACQ